MFGVSRLCTSPLGSLQPKTAQKKAFQGPMGTNRWAEWVLYMAPHEPTCTSIVTKR